ncbi:hypothetical protein Y695_04774 [Hydrogenophaga sp. T4]|nr:hypothetical protein Y695_04774 [Hydrogenophaga sp. T4]
MPMATYALSVRLLRSTLRENHRANRISASDPAVNASR